MNGDLDLRLPLAGEDDIGKIARAVNLMLDEIARLLDHLKSAGDNIAHDLRTPLAVARAKLERALDNETGTEQLRDALEAALVQIEKVSMTISAILRISAVEQGAREKQFKDFDLAAVCAQLLDFYEPLAESKGVTMIVDAATPVPVRGDQDLMREALSNLDRQRDQVHARRRRGPHRGPDGRRAALRARERHGRWRSPQERERSLTVSIAASEAAQTPGHGLGLSIAETIANLHGFKLTVEDNNPGARFELRATSSAPAVRLAREPRDEFACLEASASYMTKLYFNGI